MIFVDPAGHLAACGRAVGTDVMVDGTLRGTAGKSIRYAGEQIVPEPLDAVRQHLPFQDSQGDSLLRILCLLEPVPVSVHQLWRPDGATVSEY